MSTKPKPHLVAWSKETATRRSASKRLQVALDIVRQDMHAGVDSQTRLTAAMRAYEASIRLCILCGFNQDEAIKYLTENLSAEDIKV